MSMEGLRELADELASGYIGSRYGEQHIAEEIRKILELLLPRIAAFAAEKKTRDVTLLLDALTSEEMIAELFGDLAQKIKRPILIYTASKFRNNRYFGTRIIEEALA